MNFKQILLPVLFALFISPHSNAAELPAAQSKTLRTVRVDIPPVIDGILDDEAWKGAPVITDLHQVDPVEYAPPSQRSEFFVVYDSDALYIGAHLYDDPDKIIGNILRQGDWIFHDDFIDIIIAPFDNDRSGYSFMLSVNNVRMDGIFEGARDINHDWDGIWKTKTRRTEDGWIAEMAIPFKSLSFPTDRDTWRFSVGRSISRNREMINWHSRNNWTTLDCIGYLTGLEGMDVGRGLDIVPSVSFRRTHDYDGNMTEYKFEPSVDVFYQITPSLNASLTINTDFSATEVDERQINLTRFSLFFPEKRDFFLKDADLFSFGRIYSEDFRGGFSPVVMESGRPYFSRTIGLSGMGEPVDLEFGGKLSGRAGEWDFAVQYIRQDEFRSSDGTETLNATDILVARVARDILAESTIGAILTQGDPKSNADNTLIGLDFLYRNTRIEGQTIEAEAWYQQSDTKLGGVNVDAESLYSPLEEVEIHEGDDAAWGVSARLRNETKLRGRLMVKELEENFNPALGFVNRQGVRYYIGEVGYNFRPQHDLLREIDTGVTFTRIEDTQGNLQTSNLDVDLINFENHAGDHLSIDYARNREVLTEPFPIFENVDIPVGSYSWDTYSFRIIGADQRKLSMMGSISKGTDFNGDRWEFMGGLTWRPTKHFAVLAEYNYNDFDLPYGKFETRLMSLNTDVVFSDTLSWRTIIQYDNISRDLGIHSRLHFLPEAGRDLYLVINHNFLHSDDDYRSTRSDIVVKLNYTIRF
jgi:hypothetical protein